MYNKNGPLHFFFTAYTYLMDHGYSEEVAWVERIKPIELQTVENFFNEYVWVVLNSGMREQIARKIYNNFMIDQDPLKIRHYGKRKAIEQAIRKKNVWFSELLKSDDRIEYLESLPWIGPITKYHLARNIGIDTVKPDRHLERLADKFGFKTPDELCRAIQPETGMSGLELKLGTIDLILWRYCNLKGV